MKLLINCILVLIYFVAPNQISAQNKPDSKQSIVLNSKPYTRYWWFASEIKKEDIKYNLDWLKSNNFGGVEIAWVYPMSRFDKNNKTYTPRQEWLSIEWVNVVDYAIRYADSIGMGCDLTFGTLWPFGDTKVTFDQASQRYANPTWRQEITRSWEYPKVGYVIDHLTQKNYQPYFDRLISVFPRSKTQFSSSYFIDSWEVDTKKIWCDGFDVDFKNRYNYDITPYMDSIYVAKNKRYLYDYMHLISDKVLKFYADYDSTLNSVGILSRGQVAGAPCDLISGYASMDIPEGESMLYEPEYSTIPASAALLSRKKNVSSETFTCMYGWPNDYMRQEQAADLKLVADALFANGINHIVWHGKAHNPKDQDSVCFYATTHIGAQSALAPEIPAFNLYLEKVSRYMKRGNTYSDIAIYLPTEDAWMAGTLPKEKQLRWSWGYYEMRYVYFPDELAAFNPTWINADFLEQAKVKNGILTVGNASYKALYVNVDYLDFKVIKRLSELAEYGFKIILKKIPKEPGTLLHHEYSTYLNKLKKSKNITIDLPKSLVPFIEAQNIPRHWCRIDGKTLYIFFPNPKSDRIKFPMEYGQSLQNETINCPITLNFNHQTFNQTLSFKPYQSLLLKIDGNKIEKIDIEYIPKTPIKKQRPTGYVAPWIVK